VGDALAVGHWVPVTEAQSVSGAVGEAHTEGGSDAEGLSVGAAVRVSALRALAEAESTREGVPQADGDAATERVALGRPLELPSAPEVGEGLPVGEGGALADLDARGLGVSDEQRVETCDGEAAALSVGAAAEGEALFEGEPDALRERSSGVAVGEPEVEAQGDAEIEASTGDPVAEAPFVAEAKALPVK
jgi:hypothetical protein